ncbi:ABC transporter ATP-binding protein [Streptomyces sp. MST-110588]|uniref:ABC transporter ATP-binding protein n=1 Tax=Streptomyces sp. MST-110588 TaxID=2833628 RepID=UPI001F5CD233|nr:ABC transporter ATP-binding protein [Streptomyces sp. MST-110588]UNO41232.1 ABC transporter ATP-binding protein [Streptomyces sp. MST-110588]
MGTGGDGPGGIEALGLHHEAGGRAILRALDLRVECGESVAVSGPSGCGKSTLLGCLAGLIVPSRGTVRIAGEDVTGVSAGRRAALRLRSIGMVYQFGELLPELTPAENVALPALMAGRPAEETYARGRELLAALGVDGVRDAETGTLSGGERQRVAVARALIGRPRVVLADEPTGSLDGTAADTVAEVLFSLPARYGCALVVVTHNPDIAARAERALTLRDGRLHAARDGFLRSAVASSAVASASAAPASPASSAAPASSASSDGTVGR